jgi:hypothetical protein
MVYFSTKTEKWRGMLVYTEQQYHASKEGSEKRYFDQ